MLRFLGAFCSVKSHFSYRSISLHVLASPCEVKTAYQPSFCVEVMRFLFGRMAQWTWRVITSLCAVLESDHMHAAVASIFALRLMAIEVIEYLNEFVKKGARGKINCPRAQR